MGRKGGRAWGVSRTLQAAVPRGPKAQQQASPAMPHSGADAAQGSVVKMNKVLKGRDDMCRPFRALPFVACKTEGGARTSLALAGLFRAFGPLRSIAFKMQEISQVPHAFHATLHFQLRR